MKKLMVLLFACSMSYALNAPYLISATALSDTSVGLSWRNNDAATTGFIIQRKDSTATIFHFVDSVKSASQLTYTDMKGLLPSTLYTYQVIAYDATEVSGASNSLQVTTQVLPSPLLISATALSDSSVLLTWQNNSTTAQGFIIQRKDSTETTFKFVDSIKSSTATACTTIGLLPVTLYTFQLRAYASNSVSTISNSLQVATLAGGWAAAPP